MSNKYYLAFKPSEEVHEEVVRLLTIIVDQAAPLTVTPLDRIHVTTCFLGEVEQSVAVQVLQCCRQVRTFDVYYGGPSHFDKKVAIIKLDRGNELMSLNRVQQHKLQELKGRELRANPYNPHLTLAKYDGAVPATSAQIWDAVLRCIDPVDPAKFGKSTVSKLGLYCKSELIEEIQLAPAWSLHQKQAEFYQQGYGGGPGTGGTGGGGGDS